MSAFIPVNEPLLEGNEKKYLLECIESGWISSEGSFVKKFEQEFAARVGRRYGIAVCNGTAALDATISALELQVGDEIILPTFTIISSINQIIRLGLHPVLVDSDPNTWNIAIEQIEAKITPRTKAIMVVHTYGLPVDMDPILKLAEAYNLLIIEDAAEMHGQMYRDQPCGSFGLVSVFSFYANKIITTGEGGMIVTNNEELAHRCYSLRNLCFEPNQRFVHQRLGWNLRMTNLQAALGVAQLERLDHLVNRKRSIGQQYDQLLADLEQVQRPMAKTSYAENIYWVYGLILRDSCPINAREMIEHLRNQGVGSRPFFCPMHHQPVLKEQKLFSDEHYPVAEHLYQRGFYLPSGLALKSDQICQVVEKLRLILNQQ